ncbi:MAG: YgjP-like metallopeptidase domain-containing protein, partial [Burkholderiales bacterium]
MDRNAAKDPGQLALFDDPPPAGAGPARVLLLAGEPVEFRFERRRRRTIGVRIDADGLRVAAPLRTPWREVEGFLHEKARWILGKLAERAERGRPRPLFGETGEWLPLEGRDVMLEVHAGRKCVTLEPEYLRVEVPEPYKRGAVRAVLKD